MKTTSFSVERLLSLFKKAKNRYDVGAEKGPGLRLFNDRFSET